MLATQNKPDTCHSTATESDLFIIFYYSIFLRRCFQQLFGAAHAELKLQPSTKRQWKNIEYVFVPELTRKPHGNPSRRWAGPVTRIEHVKNGNLCCNALSRFYMGRGPWDWSMIGLIMSGYF